MFVRLSIAYSLCLCFSSLALGQHAWQSVGQWQVNRPDNDDEESPMFRAAKLPPPVDSTATATVSPAVHQQAANPGAALAQTFQAMAPQGNGQPALPRQFQQPQQIQQPQQPQQVQPAQPAQAPVAQASHVSAGTGTLPNSHGQVWREYDISQYTLRVQNVEKPEQAVVDWVIRQTGTEVWFSEPLGLLSAGRSTLKVYHTPEMQAVVKEIVDRFIGGATNPYSYGVRLLTVGDPNWRTTLHHMLRPVSVQTPGIQAWIMSKEDAAIFVSELKKRADYREYNSTDLAIYNGQVGTLRHEKPTNYIKNILFSGDAFGTYQPETGQIKEGYKVEISPLVALDGSVVDAVIKCEVDQVEKLVPVKIDVPTQLNRQRVQVHVPQLVSWRVHERFRWPADQVLVLSCGVVAKPQGGRPGALGLAQSLPSMSNPFNGNGDRADAMMLLEFKGTVNAPLANGMPAGSGPSTPAFHTGALGTYHGRY